MRAITRPAPLAGCAVLLLTIASSTGCANKSLVRFVHASPDAPAVDVYVSGEPAPLFRSLRYGQTSHYARIDAGTHTIQVRPGGAGLATAPVYTTEPIGFDPNEQYTSIGGGLFSTTNPAARFRVLNLEEDFARSDGDDARVRFVHVSPDAPAIAINVEGDEDTEVDELGRFQATSPAGVEVDAGTSMPIVVRSVEPDEPIATFTLPPLPGRGEVFAIVTGHANVPLQSPGGLSLLVVGQQGGLAPVELRTAAPVAAPVVTVAPATLYLMHAVPDVESVDVFQGSTQLVEDLEFGELSPRLTLTAGAGPLDLFPHQASAQRPATVPAASVSVPADVVGGREYLAVLSGCLMPQPGEQPVQLRTYAEQLTAAAGAPVVRVVHASPDAPAVTVARVENNVFVVPTPFASVSYGTASPAGGSALTAGVVRLGVAPTGAAAPVVSYDLDLPATLRGFLVPIGSLSPKGQEESLHLAVVNTTTTPWTVTVVEAD